MDFTTIMNPTVIVTVALAAIAFIVWLVRLEGKNSGTAKTIEKLEKEIEKLELQLKVHESNQEIHFNAIIAEKVDAIYNLRLTSMEKGIEDIQRKLNHLAGRE
jgi:uncharacterized protein YoxC